jgi:hypothetical protein
MTNKNQNYSTNPIETNSYLEFPKEQIVTSASYISGEKGNSTESIPQKGVSTEIPTRSFTQADEQYLTKKPKLNRFRARIIHEAE